MNTVSYSIIEPIAQNIRQARLEHRSVQLSVEQVTLLDEWMQSELELQADSEWLSRAAVTDEEDEFVRFEEAEKELNSNEGDSDAISGHLAPASH